MKIRVAFSRAQVSTSAAAADIHDLFLTLTFHLDALSGVNLLGNGLGWVGLCWVRLG